mgnify:CR=1 FL=1
MFTEFSEGNEVKSNEKVKKNISSNYRNKRIDHSYFYGVARIQRIVLFKKLNIIKKITKVFNFK